MTRRLRCAFANNSLKRSKIQTLFLSFDKRKLECFVQGAFAMKTVVSRFKAKGGNVKPKIGGMSDTGLSFRHHGGHDGLPGVIFLSKPNRAPTSWVCFC